MENLRNDEKSDEDDAKPSVIPAKGVVEVDDRRDFVAEADGHVWQRVPRADRPLERARRLVD